MNINERIDTIINVLFRGNKRAFAKAVGISPSVVENIVGSRKGKPSYDVLTKICANANISAEWLLLGTGEEQVMDMFNIRKDLTLSAPIITEDGKETFFTTEFKKGSSLNAALSTNDDEGGDSHEEQNDNDAFDQLMYPDREPKKLPLVSVKAVGGFAGKDFSIRKQDIESYYVIPKFRNLDVDFLIEVIGDSMMPRLFPGDIIACSVIRNPNFIQWNKTYLIATDEQGMIVKRLKKSSEKGSLLAVSDNVDYDPFDIPMADIKGLARVVGVIHAE
ncbi:MAG: hypothetical protein K2K25_01460 [Muribaculaceae bacterium]|nr:hypothetical protein [Muribaculaceae bacterium]